MMVKYETIKKRKLIDKITVFGWLSDLLTKENAETTIRMHEDKIKRIKNWMKTLKN